MTAPGLVGWPQRLTAAPRTAARWARHAPAHTPLRVKLVAALLLLVIAALTGSGVVAAATLRTYLIGRVDTQLASVKTPIAEHQVGQITKQSAPTGGGDNSSFRLPSAYVVAVTDELGALVYGPKSNLVDPRQPLPELPHISGARAQTRGTRTFTTDAVHGDDSWRVLAAPVVLADGSNGTLLIAASLREVQNTVDRLTGLFVIIGAVAVVVLAGVGYVVVRASLRPLRDVECTAAKIAEGDLSHRVLEADPRTEVGQLSGALNTMLGGIEAAFAARAASEEAARRSEERMRRSETVARHSEERMRRFVADASHELRTPLTSIRGFAELFRQGAVSEPDDIRRLILRIEDESKRMGLLVEDLLLLARLDQERPLARAPVDMLALARDAAHDAQARDHDRVITLDVGSTDPPPIVLGDEARLRQVLANLVTNAVKHTAAGTPVTVGVGTGGKRGGDEPAVVLTVVDEGQGMSQDTAARVFERFYRADVSRTRSDDSTGLGLAIVAALVAGHGGTVDVQTSPGAGACFSVTLPLAAVPTSQTCVERG